MTDINPAEPSHLPTMIRVSTTPAVYPQPEHLQPPTLSKPVSSYPIPYDPQSSYNAQRPGSQFQRLAPPSQTVFVQRRQTSSQTTANDGTIQPRRFAFRQETLSGSRILRIPSVPSALELQNLPNPTLQNNPSLRKEASTLRIPTDNDDIPPAAAVGGGQILHIDEEAENAPEHLEGGVQPFAGSVAQANVIAGMPVNPPQENNNGDAVINIEDENRQQQGTDQAASTTGRQDEGSAQDDTVSKVANKRVLFQFLFNLVVAVWYVLGYLFIQDVISVAVLFVVFLASALVYVIALFYYKGFHRNSDYISITISVLNILAYVLYAIVGYIQTQGSDVPLAPFTVFGAVLVFATCCENTGPRASAAQVLVIIERTVIWIQLLCIALKIDGLDVPWGTIFIPLYVTLILFALSSVLIIFGSVFTFCKIMKHDGISAKLVFGSIWYILNSLYVAIWLFILTEIILLLEDDDNVIKAAFITGFIHSGILLGYTLVFWIPLRNFQKFEIESEMLEIQHAEIAAGSAASAQPRKVSFKVSKENKTDLVMISPTFYTFIAKHMKNKDAGKKKKEELDKAELEKLNDLVLGPHKSVDPMAMSKKMTSSPTIQNKKDKLDLSAGNIDRQLPAAPAMKKGESMNAENLCIICFDHAPNSVLMDCGHGGICYDCAVENWKKTDNCPMCRQPVKKILKIVHFKPLNVVKVVESTTKVFE